MPSGKYDRVIQFQRASLVDDGLARVPGPPANLGPAIPARFVPGVGRERFSNQQNSATAPVVFYFPWCPDLADLTETDQVVDGARRYEIVSVRWDGRTNSEVEVSAVYKVVKP